MACGITACTSAMSLAKISVSLLLSVVITSFQSSPRRRQRCLCARRCPRSIIGGLPLHSPTGAALAPHRVVAAQLLAAGLRHLLCVHSRHSGCASLPAKFIEKSSMGGARRARGCILPVNCIRPKQTKKKHCAAAYGRRLAAIRLPGGRLSVKVCVACINGVI